MIHNVCHCNLTSYQTTSYYTFRIEPPVPASAPGTGAPPALNGGAAVSTRPPPQGGIRKGDPAI